MDRASIAFSWIAGIEKAATPAAVLSELARAGRHFGLERIIVASFPEPPKKLEPYIQINNWPAGWYERYTRNDYLHSDPVIRKLRSTTMPVVWSEAPYDPSSDRLADAVMNEAREFRLRNGLSVPIYTLSGDQAGVSFGGEHFELSEDDKAALHLIAIYGHARVCALRCPGGGARSKRVARLSPREIEILQWVAASKTSAEIGERLHISYATVETYIQRACIKLDAASRTQAVAEAIRAHLIP
jgi:LuxR family quorum sensing-dependent transcriptional regulator